MEPFSWWRGYDEAEMAARAEGFADEITRRRSVPAGDRGDQEGVARDRDVDLKAYD